MKKYSLFLFVALLCCGCNSKNNESKEGKIDRSKKDLAELPKGSWTVDKEYDENGNLIRYDSSYTWSSIKHMDKFSTLKKDSLVKSFELKFLKDFSHFEDQGFSAVFTKDSLFSKHFFNDSFFNSNFGKDFMSLDKLRQQMIKRQREFLKKYQSEFAKPDDKN